MIRKRVIIIISIVLIFIGGIHIYGKDKIPKKQKILFVQTEIQGDYYYDLVMLANGEIRQAVTPIKNVEGEKPINRKEWWERQWKEEEEERKYRKWQEIVINDELEYCYYPYSEKCDIKKEEELLGEIMEDITLYSKVSKKKKREYYKILKEVDCTKELEKTEKVEREINAKYIGYIYEEGEYKEIELVKYENGEKYINTDKSSKKLIKWLEKVMPIEEEIDIEIEQDLVFEKLEYYIHNVDTDYEYILIIDKEGNIRSYILKNIEEDYKEATYEELKEAPIIGNIGKNKLKKYYKMLLEVSPKENYIRYPDVGGPDVLTTKYSYSGYNYNEKDDWGPKPILFRTEESDGYGYHYYSIDKNSRRISHWLRYAL